MLRYNVKLNPSEIGLKEMEWNDKYVAPDLSYITGTTPMSSHLKDGDEVFVRSKYSRLDSKLPVTAVTVSRDGYCVVVDKEYDIMDAISYYKDAADLSILKENKFKYIEDNGRYFYAIPSEENDGGETLHYYKFILDDWLSIDENGDLKPITVELSATTDATVVTVDKIYWVYDGRVTIDGYEYIVDDDKPIIEDGEKRMVSLVESVMDGEIPDDDVVNCTRIDTYLFNHDVGYAYQDSQKGTVQEGHGRTWVTMFRIDSPSSSTFSVRDIRQWGYVPFLLFRNTYCPVVYKSVNDVFGLYCVVPQHLIDGRLNYTYDKASDALVETDLLCYYSDDVVASPDVTGGSVPISGETIMDCPTNDFLRANYVFVNINGVIYEINFKEVENVNSNFLSIDFDKFNPFQAGDIIAMESINDLNEEWELEIFPCIGNDAYSATSEEQKWCVVVDGEKYNIIPHACDKVVISGTGTDVAEYPLTYPCGREVGKTCVAYINGVATPMTLTTLTSATTLGYSLTQKDNDSYVSAQATYQIKKQDGVSINGTLYEVMEEVTLVPGETDETQSRFYVAYYGPLEYHFMARDVKGSNLVIGEPILSYEFGDVESVWVKESIVSRIAANPQFWNVLREPRPFGLRHITPKSGFVAYSSGNSYPTSSSYSYDPWNDLTISAINSYITLPMGFGIKTTPTINQSDLVENQFVGYESEKAINRIVDMEKDVYVPKYIPENANADESSKYIGATTKFRDISEIQINLHFRTRNQENWKVNEAYNNVDSSMCNWFITDWGPYNEAIGDDGARVFQDDASDLVGLIGFSNYDIYYQKSRVSMSFLRLSFYDSVDPQKQSLLYTATAFMDGQRLYKRYIDNMRNGSFYQVPKPASDDEIITSTTNTVMSESGTTTEETDGDGNVTARTYAYKYNEATRLDTRITIKNKYASKTSSEGFYLYMFKEYAEKLHPKPIYLKVEFNHAGVGQTLPFIVPMKWTGAPNSSVVNPSERLTCTNDDLKRGYPLKMLNSQLYIPLYAVYDFINQQYCYVFDNRYVTINDGVLTLNLFELKVNDTDEPLYTNKKGIINRNEQFPLEES